VADLVFVIGKERFEASRLSGVWIAKQEGAGVGECGRAPAKCPFRVDAEHFPFFA
jgi:hypothetical protein